MFEIGFRVAAHRVRRRLVLQEFRIKGFGRSQVLVERKRAHRYQDGEYADRSKTLFAFGLHGRFTRRFFEHAAFDLRLRFRVFVIRHTACGMIRFQVRELAPQERKVCFTTHGIFRAGAFF